MLTIPMDKIKPVSAAGSRGSKKAPKTVLNMINSIEKGHECVSSGKDGAAALKIIEAMVHSANNKGEKVYLNS